MIKIMGDGSVTIRSRREVRTEQTVELIKKIVEHLNVNDDQSRDLWHVLTALRGPDDQSGPVKDLTTAKLRRAVGLSMNVRYAIVSYENPPIRHRGYVEVIDDLRARDLEFQTHFVHHYANGIDALVDIGILKG